MDTRELGRLIQRRRKELGINQSELAMACRTGRRFISELENGKESCELGKSLRVLEGLGFDVLGLKQHGRK